MHNFDRVKEALTYIDAHLDEPLSLETLAGQAHFSPFYFHRLFFAVAGKTLAAYVRERRLLRACARLSESDDTALTIALECGFQSAQAFSRAFRAAYALSPREYRKNGCRPSVETAEEMIVRFTNRLRGGVDVKPRLMKRETLAIAGVSGDGNETGAVWERFEQLNKAQPLPGAVSANGYEIRLYDGVDCIVHVGYAAGKTAPHPYTCMQLPAGVYAVFDVYVERGYDSENAAMEEWLASNAEGYAERLLDGKHFCVEYYDERFAGEEAGSIVEIWVPVDKKSKA